jgi:hypothetical protein
MGETLGGAKETFNMVTKRTFQVAALFNAVRRGRWDEAANIMKNDVPNSVRRLPATKRLSPGFLEFQFGWRPLVQDIYSAIDIYRNGIIRGQDVSSSAGSFERRSIGTYVPNGEDQEAKPFEPSSGARVKITAKVGNANARSLNSLGLANPLLTAWENLPFSFVMDWFIPISDILGALSAEQGLKNVIAVAHRVRYDTNDYLVQGTWRLGYADKVVTREQVNPSVILPGNLWRGFNLSQNRLATAVALVRANSR